MDESVQTLLFFVAAVIAAGSFVGVANHVLLSSESSIYAKSGEFSRQTRNSVDVIHVNVSGSAVKLYAQNTGALTLALNDSRVWIDGEQISWTSTQILNSNGNSVWEPGEVAEITMTRSLSSGWHTARVLAKGSFSQEYLFKVS